MRVSLPGGENFIAQCDENLLAAAQRAHWMIRYGCRNGNCEACAATLLTGQVVQREQIIDAADGPQSILLCLAQARSDLQIELSANHLHGSVEYARRGYAQFIAQTPLADDSWALEFELPAGRQPPLYAGQFVLVESSPPVNAYIDVDALNGRRLTVFSSSPLQFNGGERLFLRYPVGYAYRLNPAQQIWLLYEDVTAGRALRLQTNLGALHCINMSTALAWPAADVPVSICAFADSENKTREWYALLLAAGITFTELRSDFFVLQPNLMLD